MDNISIFSVALGAAGVCIAGFAYLCARKGLPAAWAWVQAKWNAGKAQLATDLSAAQADIAGLKSKVTTLETSAIADVKSRLATVENDVAGLKKPAAPAPAAASIAAGPFVATPAAPTQPVLPTT